MLKKIGMRARPHKVDDLPVKLINRQEIITHVAFPVVGPIAFERVIKPFGTQK